MPAVGKIFVGNSTQSVLCTFSYSRCIQCFRYLFNQVHTNVVKWPKYLGQTKLAWELVDKQTFSWFPISFHSSPPIPSPKYQMSRLSLQFAEASKNFKHLIIITSVVAEINIGSILDIFTTFESKLFIYITKIHFKELTIQRSNVFKHITFSRHFDTLLAFIYFSCFLACCIFARLQYFLRRFFSKKETEVDSPRSRSSLTFCWAETSADYLGQDAMCFFHSRNVYKEI